MEINEAKQLITTKYPDNINGAIQNNQVVIVRTDKDGITGWSIEKAGVKAGDTVTLADKKTKAVVHWVSSTPEELNITVKA